jgi:5-methylcytosine-specific restriction endonuclease McrA
MSKNWRNGSTRRWRAVRAEVLARDGYLCQIALPGEWPVWGGMAHCTGRATQVHHTKGRAVTGDDPAYLVSACRPCNLKVGEPKVDPAPQPVTEW